MSTVEPPCRDCRERGSPRPPLSFTRSSLAIVNRTKANWARGTLRTLTVLIIPMVTWTMLAMIWVWQASSHTCAAVKLELAGTLASTDIPGVKMCVH